MSAGERNRFGLFDVPVRSQEKEWLTLTREELEVQYEAGAFMMTGEEAIEQGFLHPYDEQDTVVVDMVEAV